MGWFDGILLFVLYWDLKGNFGFFLFDWLIFFWLGFLFGGVFIREDCLGDFIGVVDVWFGIWGDGEVVCWFVICWFFFIGVELRDIVVVFEGEGILKVKFCVFLSCRFLIRNFM